MAIAAFPDIQPSVRTWTPGSQPVQFFTALSGYEARVLLGPNPIGTMLSLQFQNLTEAVGKQITNHFATANGSFETFSLPAEIFAGMSSYDYITPSTTTWRYARPPAVSYVSPGIQSVSVELIAVPV